MNVCTYETNLDASRCNTHISFCIEYLVRYLHKEFYREVFASPVRYVNAPALITESLLSAAAGTKGATYPYNNRGVESFSCAFAMQRVHEKATAAILIMT